MSRGLSSGGWALGALAAAAGACAAAFALQALALPRDFADQVGRLDADAARLATTAAAARRTTSIRADAACRSLAEEDLSGLRARLASTATGAGLTVTELSLAVAPDAGVRGPIAPVGLRLQTTGPYAATLGLLETLSDSAPAVFVEGLDLAAAAPNVKLKLTGKVYCWTSARS